MRYIDPEEAAELRQFARRLKNLLWLEFTETLQDIDPEDGERVNLRVIVETVSGHMYPDPRHETARRQTEGFLWRLCHLWQKKKPEFAANVEFAG